MAKVGKSLMKTAICLLVINNMSTLPKMAIESILENTKEDIEIFIGFVYDLDLKLLPKSNRLRYFRLSQDNEHTKGDSTEISNYIAFDQEVFFELVMLKWRLISGLLIDYELVIYTDVDLLWFKDVSSNFRELFSSNPSLQIVIQDFSRDLQDPRLCMGLFAARRGDYSSVLIAECEALHDFQVRKLGNRFSDDDAISAIYKKRGFPKEIQKLPQVNFPVGNLLNLFLPFGIFRGLRPDSPAIYHANNVVGLKKKQALLLLMSCRLEGNFVCCGKFYILYFYLAARSLYLSSKSLFSKANKE